MCPRGGKGSGLVLAVGEEGSDPAHRAAVRIWELILPGSTQGKGWDRSDMGQVVADIEDQPSWLLL